MTKKVFERTPEELHELRVRVESWLERARAAVMTFKHQNCNGTFHRDSDATNNSSPSIVTTARCYMALVYAEHQLGGRNGFEIKDWCDELHKCFGTLHLTSGGNTIYEDEANKKELNNFEVAHIADFIFSQKYCNRFDKKCSIDWSELIHNKIHGDETYKFLNKVLLEKLTEGEHSKDGQLYFDKNNPESKHFFVTLHTLRAFSILNDVNIDEDEKAKDCIINISLNAKRFCIDQCFYFHRNMRHQQDPARLVFASLLYCLYAEEVDCDVMLATVEAIQGMQEASGKWPSTRPMIRGETKTPWYISSPELSLSLTWLYFQPKLPDTARHIVLEILESHFEKWIVSTYRKHEKCKGWYDDSAAGHQRVVGWTTAIVCHFLANYNSVLNDHINRRVIETLQLQYEAQRFMIDETAVARNQRWKSYTEGGAVWPDLPPVAWSSGDAKPNDLTEQIIRDWSDPRDDAALASALAKEVVVPILDDPQQRPKKKIAGILNGPPGTRKTSIVKKISELLDWPYVPIPASVIFSDGFDNLESRATQVFRRLNYLTNCVIFFDEFEEFVLTRPNRATEQYEQMQTTHDRTIAAFTTSSMLPRFQDLHDQKRSLVLFATNDVSKIDGAIKRAGRFDFIETVDYPLVSRFIGENSYLLNPGKINLRKFAINSEAGKKLNNSEKRKLKEIQSAICKALEDSSVMDLLVKIQPILRERASEIDEKFLNPGSFTDVQKCRVPFEIVELAAVEAAEKIESEYTTNSVADPPLGTEKAKQTLVEQLEKLIKNEGAPGKLV